MTQAVCIECRRSFDTATTGLTCSVTCRKLHARALKAEAQRKRREARKKLTVPIQCSECPKLFVRRKSIDMTCGPECSTTRKLRIQRERGKRHVSRDSVIGVPRHSPDWTPPKPGLPVAGMAADVQAYANWGIRYEAI